MSSVGQLDDGESLSPPSASIVTMRSATVAASSRSWVTTSAVVPAAREHPGEVDGEAVVQLAVEAGERLVEQQRAGRRGQRAGERDALGLAAAQLGDRPVLEAGEADEVEHLGDAPVARPARSSAVHAQPEVDVGGDVAVGEQLLVLEHHADAAPVRRARR